MQNVSFEYSDEEYGWVSEEIELTGNIVLLVSLKEKGVVVVTKRNADETATPKVCITKVITETEINFSGECNGMYLRVLTSTEPESIKVVNV